VKFPAKAEPVTDTTCLAHGVCEVTLETSDRSALEAFYTSALGLKVLSREADRTWLACGPRARLGLWTPGEKEFGDEGGRHVHFALSVSPGVLNVVCGRLCELGVEFQGPGRASRRRPLAVLRGSGRNVLELWDFFQRGEGSDGVAALASSGG
jgi:catechol 2,3-dioxygenase-like lactoylglutathione lyase family enzyme